jgi:Ca-activated chloride channel family protein
LHGRSAEAGLRQFAIVPVFTMLVAVAYAQAPVPPLPALRTETPTVFRSHASVVALNVTVTDGNKPVAGLGPLDFQIFEDGVPQRVSFFETRSVPMDVILLLDTSASMRARMPVVHEAAKSFMRVLRPEDRGAVVAFNDSVRVLQGLTSDPAAIESAISSTSADGSTALHTALYVALKQFGAMAKSSDAVRRQAIAVLSDGVDTSSLVSFDDVVAVARRTGVNVYTIALRDEGASSGWGQAGPDSEYGLRVLAKETGAASFFPANIRELKGVYRAIANELEAQYSIAYTPTDSRADGRFRRIVVRVPSRPGLQPRARAGYTAVAGRASAEAPAFPR